MGYVEWSTAYEMGIPGIDYEHRKLISMLNDIHTLIARGAETQDIGDSLVEFHTLATAHFALEEMIMQANSYAGLAERRITHRRLLDQVSELIDDCEAGSSQLDKSLPAMLKDWLLEAMAGDVKLLAKIDETGLRRQGSGEADDKASLRPVVWVLTAPFGQARGPAIGMRSSLRCTRGR